MRVHLFLAVLLNAAAVVVWTADLFELLYIYVPDYYMYPFKLQVLDDFCVFLAALLMTAVLVF
jgi:hypothetical protein